MKKSMSKIIEEVASSYTSNTRSVGSSISRYTNKKIFSCVYTNYEEKHCAVGRYLLPEYQYPNWFLNNEDIEGLKAFKGSLDSLLVEEVRGYSISFWSDLQLLHDIDSNWNENGLSLKGEKLVAELLVKYQ